MQQKTQIRSLQAGIVIFASIIGTVYFPLAAAVVPFAGASSWLAVLISFLAATPLVLLATWLAKQAPAGNFGVAVREWLGPFVGTFFLLWFAGYWLLLASTLLAEISFIFRSIVLPATPVNFMIISLLLLVIYTDLQGFETCIRTVQVLFLLAIPLIVIFQIAAFTTTKWANLLPLIDASFMEMAKASYFVSPYPLSGILLTLFITVKTQDRHKITKYNILANWLAGLLLAVTVALTVGVLGCSITKASLYPTVTLAHSITVGNTLKGIEAFLYPLWLISGYGKAAIAFIISSEAVGSIFPGMRQPWRTLSLGALSLLLAMLPQNLKAAMQIISMRNYYLGIPFYLAIPAIAIWVKIKKWVRQS